MWNRVVEPSCLTSKELGNTYCASIFNGLVSLLCNYSTELLDKRIALFAYGSGLASTLFTLKISSHAEQFLISTRENNEL